MGVLAPRRCLRPTECSSRTAISPLPKVAVGDDGQPLWGHMRLIWSVEGHSSQLKGSSAMQLA
jgi:hypothetical protein